MKRIAKTFIILALSAGLIHCSGQSLIDTDPDANLSPLGALNLGAVQSLESGDALAASADGHKALQTSLGFDLHLTEAQINWRELKLLSSGADPECVGGNDQTIALDQFQDLLGADLVETSLGSVEVPLTGYCSFALTIAPTPAGSALKLHEGHEHEGGNTGIDVSFHVEGEWSKDATSGSFLLQSTEPVTITGDFMAEEDGELTLHPLHFHGDDTAADLNFGVYYDLLFEGIDFASDDEVTQRTKFMQNLQGAVHQHLAHH